MIAPALPNHVVPVTRPLRADAPRLSRADAPRLPRWAAALLLISSALAVGQPGAARSREAMRPQGGAPSTSIVVIPAGQRSKSVTLAVGKAMIVDLPEDAAEVFVGNPTVANAVVRSARRLYVMAIGKGPTTIVAFNKSGAPLATMDFNVTARDLAELDAILAAAIPNNDIHTQQIDNTVILTGSVASALEAQRAEDIANGFTGYTAEAGGGTSNSGSGSSVSFGSSPVIVSGSKPINALVIRGQDQVMLKVQVVEVQREIVKQLGVSVNGSWSGTGVTGSASSVQQPSLSSVASNASDLALTYKSGASTISSSIQAFERNGVARVLAEPTVTAISGESARFTAGGTIPVASSSSKDTTTGVCTVTTVQQDYGVTLNFTPTVLSGGRISLHLATEVSEPDPTSSVQYSCSNAIGFRTRKNTTTVELPSGGSIVSAGLIQQASKQAIAGIPGLMNLPILGTLFRSRDYQRSESELMIIVTPYLVRSLKPEEISKPDDGFADATDPQSWLLGRMNRIYSTTNNPELIKTYRGKVGFIAD